MEETSMAQIIRLIKPQNVPIELESSDVEDETPCRLCNKTFANMVALKNHVRIMHSVEYEAGANPDNWYPQQSQLVEPRAIVLEGSENQEEDEKKLVEKKTAELMMSLKPQSLMSLASEDVSYIIIKAEPEDETEKAKKRKLKEEKEKEHPTPKRNYNRSRDKEPETITGPFECLEPSSHVADSTCHQIFFSCCEYSIHHRDEHSRRRRMPRCQVCERLLNEGPADPTKPEYPYPCQVCGEGFHNNKMLQEHTSTAHVKLKPFQCSICLKRFTQQGGLQQHMRMHSGDRPYPCNFCSKAFTQKSGRDQHLRTHTKIKPYRCVVCSKTFCQPVHLKQHMRTHTNVAPFECGLCNKRFKQSSHLNYHLKSHNESEFTEEQKEKFANLLYVIQRYSDTNKEGYTRKQLQPAPVQAQQGVLCIGNEDGSERVAVDSDVAEVPTTSYVLNEHGNQAWCVKLVS
ncbi:Zinc finger protein 454 [Eumeta japonica]|uniref:Zinc finger protein 454 n=1 Tax=Eumeta variegata TaxID=151549 RepID=A0A4C1YFW5_EUMVA|nr:Zinc finger protein 454 [Eumeta japonica]